MTEWTILVSDKDVLDQFYRGELRHLIRNENECMKRGDKIKLQYIKDRKRVYHPVSRILYTVTRVDNYRTVPIDEGNQIISVM